MATIGALSMAATIVTFLCPESPVWLVNHHHDEKAIEVLKFFRGSAEAADLEFDRIKVNLMHRGPAVGFLHKMKDMRKQIAQPVFWKPFSLLMVMSTVGLSWSGFAIIGFYMVQLIQVSH